ncbi:MOSC domain-containing protein [Pikeienuella piscinae]|uniref:MOSC domain-containing protein n=1 Tax=Pikeienuella piscinae TaxID=2748098 RepID=A0A7L5C3L2_9RHOB|nr:MOSC N-terminal beta barrel domain-containing protein [Pikeienuella piscinae]QIE57086.1 MOSC domain-containing protein [Pikeienuella piscinae]
MGRLTGIRRHPVKGLGDERLEAVVLSAGRHVPWDRAWAVAHGKSAFDPVKPEWVARRNFVVQANSPELSRIACAYDEAGGRLSFSHPALGALDADPGAEGERIADWIAPVAAGSGPGPYTLVRLPNGGVLTDVADAHVSIGNLATLRALEEIAGRKLAPIRFRMNLWLDGFAPWEEFDWLGREISVGAARLRVTARVTRCTAPAASPDTGARDVEVTKLLHAQYRHTDFGVYSQVVRGGEIAIRDEAGT